MRTPDERAAAFLKAITILRVFLVPIVMWLILAEDDPQWATAVATGLFAFGAVTDFFDGLLARRWAQTSTLGAFLDTTADKLLVTGALFALVAVGRASIWIASIIVARELVVLGLRGVVAAGDGTVVKPSIWGKLKANAQFLAIILAIWRPDVVIGDRYLDQWVMLAAGIITVLSAVEYFTRFGAVFRRGPRATAPSRPPAPRA
ncbi:MAG: CDP-diacylglycerol--glycerol-3-phosphate 3-phosphatidyltransferase [Actinomycetota bacterium]